MDGFQVLQSWLTRHEQLLSALAAMVVIAGVVIAPLGPALRTLLRRRQGGPGGNGAGGLASFPAPPEVEDRPSIAVLPFTNMSDEREQEFLADGMTEDVITGLSLSRSLFVIARNSTFTYKGKAVKVLSVQRRLVSA